MAYKLSIKHAELLLTARLCRCIYLSVCVCLPPVCVCVSQIVSEVDSVIGDRTPTIDDIKKLNYTRNTLAESLRLYPQVRVCVRVCVRMHVCLGSFWPGRPACVCVCVCSRLHRVLLCSMVLAGENTLHSHTQCIPRSQCLPANRDPAISAIHIHV